MSFTGEDGDSRIVEIQTFIGNTPGDAKPAPGGDADDTHNAHEVSNKVSLYPRLWFQVDGPHYGQPLSALYACPTVALDRPDGTPDPEMEQYDPLHPSYLGTADAFRP
ncbi:hypothetical protein GCM10020255_024130 [Rhodococcus baikonurensis]